MGEKDPYLILRSQPDPNYTHDYWGDEYFSSDRQKALQTIQTTKSSIVVLLNRIHKFTSHTFHVVIRKLIPGAKQDKSNLFTMIKEHWNQYMIRARETNNLVPYTICQEYFGFYTLQICQDQCEYNAHSLDKNTASHS
jgi:hypothetical protein